MCSVLVIFCKRSGVWWVVLSMVGVLCRGFGGSGKVVVECGLDSGGG